MTRSGGWERGCREWLELWIKKMSEVEESLQEFACGRWLDEGSVKRYILFALLLMQFLYKCPTLQSSYKNLSLKYLNSKIIVYN